MQYKRTNVTGGTYFFTVNLEKRKNTLLFDKLRTVINTKAALTCDVTHKDESDNEPFSEKI